MLIQQNLATEYNNCFSLGRFLILIVTLLDSQLGYSHTRNCYTQLSLMVPEAIINTEPPLPMDIKHGVQLVIAFVYQYYRS